MCWQKLAKPFIISRSLPIVGDLLSAKMTRNKKLCTYYCMLSMNCNLFILCLVFCCKLVFLNFFL